MKIFTEYSKPSIDIKKEESNRRKTEADLFKKQKKALLILKKSPSRLKCLLCAKKLTGASWDHRGFEAIICGTCGHIQSKKMPPKGFPFISGTGYSYASIYPNLSPEEFEDRKKRIYVPKLAWIVKALSRLGFSKDNLKKKKWLEIGCGAGYFLSALKDFGVHCALGLETDKQMLSFARNQSGTVQKSPNRLDTVPKKFPADIYVAFFVFEHIDPLHDFLRSLASLPRGAALIFSVPFFGLTHLFEEMLPENYARSFDGAVHTQIFTQESIEYALGMAGFELKAQWIFGQDSSDILRHIFKQAERLPSKLRQKIKRLENLEDSLQSIIDQIDFADQRHFIAFKK